MRNATFFVGLGIASLFSATAARAGSATISIGDGRFSDPPPIVIVRDAPPPLFEPPPQELPKDPYRAPFRLTLGPAAITSGQGFGPGLVTAADFGSGAVGVRFSAGWFRGESPNDPNARLGNSVGLYSGELVLDLNKTGPFHPLLGLGLGAINVSTASLGSGWGFVGLGRVGLEYALTFEEADVRFGVGLTGALLGPADDALSQARALAMMNATFSIGF